jgi:hypothetical protein
MCSLNTVVAPAAGEDSCTYFSCLYCKELQILRDIEDASSSFGKAYQHFTRYRILGEIANATGLRLDKPQQTMVTPLEPPLSGKITLMHASLFKWAGVVAGTFNNHRTLMVSAEQR